MSLRAESIDLRTSLLWSKVCVCDVRGAEGVNADFVDVACVSGRAAFDGDANDVVGGTCLDTSAGSTRACGGGERAPSNGAIG